MMSPPKTRAKTITPTTGDLVTSEPVDGRGAGVLFPMRSGLPMASPELSQKGHAGASGNPAPPFTGRAMLEGEPKSGVE